MPLDPMTFGISGDVTRTERLKTGASSSLQEIIPRRAEFFAPPDEIPARKNFPTHPAWI